VIVRSFKDKRREGRFKERYFESLQRGGRALEVESSGEQGFRPGLNIRGQQGIRLMPWRKASERRWKACKGFQSKRRDEIDKGNLIETAGLEKSSEERSPRTLGAERGFRGRDEAETIGRVAKPCGWNI
jgi:hypothetical protein